jgi:perosamine synthetase
MREGYMVKDVALNILPSSALLRDVLVTLNKGVFGVVFIADKDHPVQGLFTDGDVRRALLDGAVLETPVLEYMKKDFIFGTVKKGRDENIKLLSEKVRHLPILDDKGQLVDFLSWAEMWRLPVMEPRLGGNELKYVSDCITSNWISSQGSYVKKFEKKFAGFLDIDHSLTTTSGTTALHLALTAMGIGPGDEVIVPNLTFAASANVVIHAGATPVFVDVSHEHWTIDPALIESVITSKTKAIMPVHLYGHPCDMDPIMEIARKYNLFVVEDCAEALGALYKGQPLGTLGDVGCFSFFSNKVITTGEGGMIVTRNRELHENMLVLRDHGMSKTKRYWHEVAGFNYRMTNLQAAVGLAQLEQIDSFLDKRRKIAEHYAAHLKEVVGLTLPPEKVWAKNIYWLYSILIDESVAGISRDALIKGLECEGIETRPFFCPLHNQPPYVSTSFTFPVTDKLANEGISLPSSNTLSPDEIRRVCENIKKLIKHHKIINDVM